MSSDDVARQLGAAMKEEQARHVDPRLEALARQELDDEECTDLEREARRDPNLALALQLHRPMSRDFLARLNQLARRSAAQPRPTRTLRRAAVLAVGTALAMAAGWTVVLNQPPRPLPDYVMAVDGASDRWRSGSRDREAFQPNDTLTLILRPRVADRGPITAELWVETNGEGWRRSTGAPEVSEEGAVRWKAPLELLVGPRRGRVPLLTVIGRTGHLPKPNALSQGLNRGPGWQVLRTEIEVRQE